MDGPLYDVHRTTWGLEQKSGCSPAAPHLKLALELVAQSGVHLLAVLLHVSAQGLQRCQVPSKLLSYCLQVHGGGTAVKALCCTEIAPNRLKSAELLAFAAALILSPPSAHGSV